ncbi:ribonuclease HII [Candidatus Daviesbacteria bacterium]|nr:ribonuclease HII [Candidatus Daviesbacteria bacterium]
MLRSLPTLEEEQTLWSQGYRLVAGFDEVGRGSWAGPVVVGAVVFPQDCQIHPELKDSKQLSAKKRQQLLEWIKKVALAWAIAETGVDIINKLGIGKATQIAFRKTFTKIQPDYVLMDAFYIKHILRKYQKPIIKGDEKCASIAAASILAKVYRDDLMVRLNKTFPQYGFDKHKGYGTRLHQDAIAKYGLSQVHRTSFNLQKFLH